MRSAVMRVGTAGWSVASRYQALFAPSGSHLERYAQRLNAVEINSSFYRHHRASTYRRWADSAPADFRFAVKVPRTLTHGGALTPLPDVLERFATEVEGLDTKLGVLLVQLPPKLAFNASIAQRFFAALRKRINAAIACEPRHPSWSSAHAARVLTECGVARVAADPSLWPGADQPDGCDRLAYFRWHGQPQIYYSNYNQQQLEALWHQVSIATNTAEQVWVIFDNTALGHALGNALTTLETMKLNTVSEK